MRKRLFPNVRTGGPLATLPFPLSLSPSLSEAGGAEVPGAPSSRPGPPGGEGRGGAGARLRGRAAAAPPRPAASLPVPGTQVRLSVRRGAAGPCGAPSAEEPFPLGARNARSWVRPAGPPTRAAKVRKRQVRRAAPSRPPAGSKAYAAAYPASPHRAKAPSPPGEEGKE